MGDLQDEVQRMNNGSKSGSKNGSSSLEAAEEQQQAAQRDKGQGKAGRQAAASKKQLAAHVGPLR